MEEEALFISITCRSSVDSLVSGLVLPFRTISVLGMNPDTESTSSPAPSSTGPDAVKPPFDFHKGTLFLKQRQHHLANKRSKHSLLSATSKHCCG